MKKILLLLMLLCGVQNRVAAQGAYFQQDVHYTIRVNLDDKSHQLTGIWEMGYKNNSQVTLDTIYIHLWPNAYSGRRTELAKQELESGSLDFYYAKPEQRGSIDSLYFTQEDLPLTLTPYKGKKDVVSLKLVKPIPPGGSTVIRSPFRVKIPGDFSRMGHVGQQYQITQWFPKPAVFDRDGWHPIPYLDQGEFYSEYGTFDVFITVPKNYVVGATGDLPDGDPELDWLKKREAKSREMLDKEGELKFEMEFGETETKTLHFHQENVHDFAWFCDKQYMVITDSVVLPASGRKVQCVAMFPPRVRKTWKDGAGMVGRGVVHYSKYNGDYPYRHCTAVEGALSAGGGMEYPNITVVSAGGSTTQLEEVIVHEVGHNWFFGILGSNERLHPWMDEGVNTYFENRFMNERFNGNSDMLPGGITRRLGIELSHTRMLIEAYRLSASGNTDQPIELPAEKYTPTNYGTIVYMKTGLSFRYLEEYLTKDVIDRCWKAYYEKWKFKHPRPEDMQEVFEKESGKDLDWFFGDFIKTSKKIDFRIKSVKDGMVTVQNLSKVKAPVSITLVNEDGTEVNTVWTEPFTGVTTVKIPQGDGKFLRANASMLAPELRQENNLVRTSGLFKRCKPVQFNFLYKYPDPGKTIFNWAPVMGYNTTDGFMLGLGLYHNIFPKKRFEFHVMPMYGFGSKSFTGLGGATYRILPKKLFRTIEFSSRSAFFSDLLRTRNSITFRMKDRLPRTPFNETFTFNFYHLALRSNGELNLQNYYKPVYASLNWDFSTPMRVHGLWSSAEIGGNFTEKVLRLSAEISYERRILRKIRARVRLFGAGIIAEDNVPWLLQYRPDGSGDPFGQTYIADRASESSWLSHQRTDDHGAFRSIVGESFNRSLWAMNFQVNTPIRLIHLFGDIGAGHSAGSFGDYRSGLLFDAGISLGTAASTFRINLPVFGSCYSNGIPQDFSDFWSNITFSLDFGKLMKSVSRQVPGL